MVSRIMKWLDPHIGSIFDWSQMFGYWFRKNPQTFTLIFVIFL